ncbi:hypothetical protein FRACA_1260009 [Frankia canadensis]|uniref:Uncharacterized protein n=1 Tax=Frankia canadensis TaxID=1836972 RepID=A0A2I2KKB5_9ACTN|nr:hypothetical protein FRACA_1260009 [Frankia canadensis]SOU53401.1 hypothetical protein FRACA_1260009 [Frankia canadensis]
MTSDLLDPVTSLVLMSDRLSLV